jgi:hypothetical protein
MNGNIKNIAMALLLTAMAACASMAPIENINNASIPTGTHKLSDKEVGSVIAKAALERGWAVTQAGPNRLHASLNAHDARATVNITYSASSYSITYISSDNYDKKGGEISAAYNRYIEFLNKSISKNLNVAVF